MSKSSIAHPGLPLAVLLVLWLVSGHIGAQQRTIRIATEGAYEPWNFTDASGQLVGFEVDLARDLCRRMNARCEILTQSFDGLIPALRARKYDAIMAAMSMNEKRKRRIAFSRYYAATPSTFVVIKEHPLARAQFGEARLRLDRLSAQGRAQLARVKRALGGAAIGVRAQSAQERYLRTYLGSGIELRTYATDEDAYVDVLNGRLDAAFGPMNEWVSLLESEGGRRSRMVGPRLSGGPLGAGVGVGLRRGDRELAALFSRAIDAAINDGTLARLSRRWFGFDVSAHN